LPDWKGLGDGGRDRDRTCDPHDVNIEITGEAQENQGFSGALSGVFGTMFRDCSAFLVQRTSAPYVRAVVRSESALDSEIIPPGFRYIVDVRVHFRTADGDTKPKRNELHDHDRTRKRI
jgi:hypothetical protein